ncbi:MAG: AAA family ATPase, partial [Clostridia bacterium]|nr:AAA family ATPase [Clostridia bacterium]
YANGEIYEGSWVDDQRCGYGRLYLPKGFHESYSYSGEWKNDLLNGKGKFTDGNITYEGNFLNGKYHGEGTLTKKLNTIYYTYKGNFKNGLKDGNGTEICQEYTYVGAFINDKFDGNGKKEFKNGDFFEGTFASGVFQKGNGKITDKENTVYQGELRGNIPNGSGKYIYNDGKIASGVFDNGMKQGKFLITLNDGTKYTEEYKNDVLISSTKGRNPKILAVQEKARKSAFEALSLKSHIITNSYSNNKKIASKPTEKIFYNSTQYELYCGQKNDKNELHGFGVLTLANSTYEGEFINGKISGLGIYTVPGQFKYYGECSEITNNIRVFSSNGCGVRSFDNGNEYAGDFKLGGFSGFGVYSYANGDKYEGEFNDGKFHGRGVFTYASGDIYEGEFRLGSMEGEFSIFSADGSIRKETYKDNKPVSDANAKLALDTSNNRRSASDEINKSIEKTVKSRSKKTTDERSETLKPRTKKETVKKESSKATSNKKNNDDTSGAKDNKSSKNENKFVIPPYVRPQEIEDAVSKAKEAAEKAKASAQLAEKHAKSAVDTMNKNLNDHTYKSLQPIVYKNPDDNKTYTYKGFTVGDMLQGFGSLSCGNTYKFHGKFIANNIYGDGVLYYDNGDGYEGSFLKSMREGDGIYYYNSGSVYKGHFFYSNLHGSGIFIGADGTTYEGDYYNDKRTGYGIYRCKDYTYEGQFSDNEKHGYGIIYTPDGFRFEGQFSKENPCGRCTAIFKDGSRLVGQFNGDYSSYNGTLYQNEKIDEGAFIKGKLNGNGKRLLKNGDCYEGDFKDGSYDGVGTYLWKSGEKYTGSWKSNKFNGKGTCYFANGDVYTGQWKNDKRNGKGTHHFANGDVYTGQWKNGEKHGTGCYTWGKSTEQSGDKYEGDWNNGFITGKGVYTFANGDRYEGDFVDGKHTGKGIFTWLDGDRYEGDFVDGKRTGKGIYIWANGDRYEGDFVDSKCTGKGVYIWANGSRYEGDFVDDKRTGKGIYIWANGDRYEGDFVNNEHTGKGVFAWANGDKYEGDLVNGSFHGQGTFTYADGKIERGEWKNGEFVDKKLLENNNQNSNNQNVSAVKNEAENPLFSPESTNGGITFKDVAGLNDVKEQITFHVLEPMKNPELAKAYGIKPGGKILLYGPPGTGKTLVARTIAGEIDAPFFSVSCQDLISKWLGESSERLNNLFDEVEKHEKAIVFFDEFDSVAAKRDDANQSKEIARFVATFLTRVDGFKPTQNKMLLLIAATNRPWSIDSAMLRGGRFDTQIYVGVPDKEAREFLVNKSLGKLPLNEDVDLNELAMRFEGFGGGDITAICDKIGLEAYKKSVKLGKMQKVSREDCENALKNAKNSITAEELDKFEAYKKGIEVK